MDASAYLVSDMLRDGRRVDIRAQRPTDRDAMEAAFRRFSPATIYRRFFAAKTGFTEKEVAFYLEIDFVRHVGLVAELEEAEQKMIAGGGRYIVTAPGQAEVAFAVEDRYQGQGIGSLLLAHLVAIAREAGIKTFIGEVLPANAPMLRVFEKSGLGVTRSTEQGVVRATLVFP